jgi:O-antigen/teichoic acid export membrane protein
MLIAAVLPAKMLGLYVVAVAWSNAVHPLLNALGAVVFPRVASQGRREEQARALAQGARLGALLSLVIAIALMVLTPWMLPVLFGGDFSAAIPAALVLVIAAAVAGLNMVLEEGLRGLAGLNMVLEEGLRGLGQPASVMWAEFGGLAVTAMALFLLLPSLKIMGAAIASLLGYTTVGVLLIAQARRLTGYSAGTLLCTTVAELASGWKRVKVLMEAMAK